jgi:hypothetical protein
VPSYDSIVVGEDWISEHYFTTDSPRESFQGKVIELRKQWDAEAAEGRDTVRRRLLAAAGELQTTLSTLAEDPDGAAAAHALIRRILGFPEEIIEYTGERAGTELRLPGAQLAGVTSTLFLQATPVTSIDDLLDPQTGLLLETGQEENKSISAVSKAVSAAFRADDPPAFIAVQAGQWLLLAEAERWAEGRYLAVDLLVVAERRDDKRGGEIDRAAAMLSRQALLPDADGNIWWAGILEDSVKHTVGVSKDLREGIRLSIEIIANDVVRRRDERGLPLEQIDAPQLAKQSLRFLYRILFLLYAEASPEMKVLPSGAPEYAEGYGLDRLRELTLTELVSPQAKSGTHLYESLATLFRLVDEGHAAQDPAAGYADDPAPGLEFNALRADLFASAATALIDHVGLSNEATQRVLQHLLLSKESKGRKGGDRGFISYAELGINQLGAVYEGLMSYTGFFATEDLYEVAKNGDPEKGSWVVPVTNAEHLSKSDFVTALDEATGEQIPVIHRRGTFVYRLAGRERQQSASYYTPEVLTKFVVSQALEELLDQDGERTDSDQILQLSICEPALGSGAFAIEAVRQLAAEYLKRKQEDLGQIIDADQYQVELQKVKAYLALHQVYGVDLNATAVELAEISLWLDTMVAGLQAPWFGLHLRRGNSLIGARRAVYAPNLLAKKAWLTTAPEDKPLGEEIGTGIHHFLLPSQGWGAVIDTPEAKTYAPDKREELRLWRNGIRSNPSAAIKKRLDALARRVETLWQFTLRRLTIAESEVRREIDIWGFQQDESSGQAVTREQIEAVLQDENGAYRRLRRVLDAWCALWFWPLTADVEPPDWDLWVGALEAIVGVPPKEGKFEKYGQTSLADQLDWDELDAAEENDRLFSQAQPIRNALDGFPWLMSAAKIAAAQGFFHWDLDFAPVFARGGFDLQVGNPPWVRPDWDEAAILAEFDPRWGLEGKVDAGSAAARRSETLEVASARNYYLDLLASQLAIREAVSHETQFPNLVGLRPDLYRCFMEQTWRHAKTTGSVGLIHPETHFTDEKAGSLREATYRRLRRHWQFINELVLFEIHHLVSFGVHVYGAAREDVSFLQATSLYHPDTAERSLKHDGSGVEPGLKDDDGNWDVRPHRNRVLVIDAPKLMTWHALLEAPGIPVEHTRMVYTVNRSATNVLDALTRSPRLSSSGFEFSMGWNEIDERKAGLFEVGWGTPDAWSDTILMGPHLHVAIPYYKSPNPSMANNLDWTPVDLEHLAPNAIPTTTYKRSTGADQFGARFPRWGNDRSIDARGHYRLAWRSMAATSGERTLIPAIVPPGAVHLKQNIYALGYPEDPGGRKLSIAAGFASSLIADLFVRAVPKSSVPRSVIAQLPVVTDKPRLIEALILRVLRLNCLTDAYSDLWSAVVGRLELDDAWTGGIDYPSRPRIADVPVTWGASVPLRRAADRRQALVEIDALVAIMLGVSAEELCTVYRTQFAVLFGYDRSTYVYDANGRLVPAAVQTAARRKNGELSQDTRTALHPGSGVTYVYEPPFQHLDRASDMRHAYGHFAAQAKALI